MSAEVELTAQNIQKLSWKAAQEVLSGEMDPSRALAFAANNRIIIQSINQQMKYFEMVGQKPDLPYLSASKKD